MADVTQVCRRLRTLQLWFEGRFVGHHDKDRMGVLGIYELQVVVGVVLHVLEDCDSIW